MRIALATVSGFSTRRPSTSGAAPSAWKPSIFGAEPDSRKPFQYAVMLPALPTGMHSPSISPIASSISNAAVFCPSSRSGLTELTSEIGCLRLSSRTISSASSKLPRRAITRAPCMSAWASLPAAILPSGTITAPPIPARAAYAASEAAVLPVDAQTTASAPSRTAAETAHVMPRSLNDPVGFAPSNLSQTSAPTRSESRGAGTSGVEPSPRETTGSPSANGSRSRKRSMTPGVRAASARFGRGRRTRGSFVLLLDDADGPRARAHEVEAGDQLAGREELRFRDGVHDHHEPRLLPQPLLDHRLDGYILQAEHLRHLREHAGPVVDLHVQVERRLDVLDDRQVIGRRGRGGGRDHRA